MLCSNCGKENVSYALYCYNCGIRLNQDTDLAEPHLLVDSGSYPEEITENVVCAENQQKRGICFSVGNILLHYTAAGQAKPTLKGSLPT